MSFRKETIEFNDFDGSITAITKYNDGDVVITVNDEGELCSAIYLKKSDVAKLVAFLTS